MFKVHESVTQLWTTTSKMIEIFRLVIPYCDRLTQLRISLSCKSLFSVVSEYNRVQDFDRVYDVFKIVATSKSPKSISIVDGAINGDKRDYVTRVCTAIRQIWDRRLIKKNDEIRVDGKTSFDRLIAIHLAHNTGVHVTHEYGDVVEPKPEQDPRIQEAWYCPEEDEVHCWDWEDRSDNHYKKMVMRCNGCRRLFYPPRKVTGLLFWSGKPKTRDKRMNKNRPTKTDVNKNAFARFQRPPRHLGIPDPLE